MNVAPHSVSPNGAATQIPRLPQRDYPGLSCDKHHQPRRGFGQVAKLWVPLGSGVTNNAGATQAAVLAMTVEGTNLYVGGLFTIAGGQTVNRIARWDGRNWFPLGSGTGIFSSSGVEAMGIIGNEVYVTGNFTTAGGIPSLYFGIWHIPPFVVRIVAPGNGGIVLNWESEPNQTYEVCSTGDLSLPFAPLSGIIPSAGTTTSYTNSSANTDLQFYQVKQVVP